MRLGIYQCDAGGLSTSARLRALELRLAEREADLMVCPELFLSGYMGADHAALAEPATGPFFQDVAEMAKRHETAVCYGYPEAADGVVYNAARLVGADGAALANHRKRLPSPGSFEEETFANGDNLTLVDHGGMRIAIIICYEVELPESLRKAALHGAELALVPTALVDQWGVVAEKLVPTRAFENGLWLAYANHAGEEGGARYLGGSRIVAPDGVEEAVAGTEETVIAANVDPARVVAARNRLPYLRDAVKL
ncbi:(R)-stereoselective amidase [Roseovarius sp. THAF9]|uniref:nitrilase-related carbon-nitrogen hydrolase n=1 Tax=Roseovarius sp. THAF9 TaxID=2587847 RepID=UPI0012686260|nr:nitrilase-related carbon-nitrogen hydrolase [Roseovarius sp. THAF9]QFT92752.1 (R)-stereoselective amidase [Roseovarius sp. THAF9]